jgi:ribonuclease HI
MTEPTEIWICAAHHPAFRCGGWAFVRRLKGQLSGTAGGERYTTARRMALAGLVSALSDLPAGETAVRVETTSPELSTLTRVLAGRGEEEEDLDLWAQVLTAAKGRRIELARVAAEPRTPSAFATAWAELAMDKAKAAGAFTAAIPKPNLAKAPGLAPR